MVILFQNSMSYPTRIFAGVLLRLSSHYPAYMVTIYHMILSPSLCLIHHYISPGKGVREWPWCGRRVGESVLSLYLVRWKVPMAVWLDLTKPFIKLVLSYDSFSSLSLWIFCHLSLSHIILFSVPFFSLDIIIWYCYNLFHQCCRLLDQRFVGLGDLDGLFIESN